MATYANTLRLYDVNVQLVIPNALNTATRTLSEQKQITVNSVVHKTGDYIHIKYKVPFNGLTSLSSTNNTDGELNRNIINALGLSAACKELLRREAPKAQRAERDREPGPGPGAGHNGRRK